MAPPQDDFPDRPFSRLASLHFSERQFRNAASAREPRSFRCGLEPEIGHDDPDRELFRSAMRRLAARPQGKLAPAFTIADQCTLPRLSRPVERCPDPEQQATPDLEMTDDEDLFLKAASGSRPLAGGGREISRRPELGSPPALGRMSLQDFMEGRLEFAISNTDEYFEGHVVGLDELTMNKLRQGGFSPEAHLDLHGLNSMQAFEAMRHFFRAAWYKSLRCVLLVPGRGRNSPDGLGVLRAKLQIWLVQEPFKRIVLAFCTAQPHDGGPGSVYVLLRKFRKKGRIFWDRMPMDPDLY